MIAGDKNRFAIEAQIEEEVDGWLLGRFRFWLCGRSVGNWDDAADLRACVRWLRDFSVTRRDRYEPGLDSAPPEEVFRCIYDTVMGQDGPKATIEESFSRFHISHLGMSAFEYIDMLLIYDALGAERCLWRSSGAADVQECRLGCLEMESVAREFCDLFKDATSA